MRDGKKVVKDEQGRSESRQTQKRLEQIQGNPSHIKSLKTEIQDSEAWYRALFDNANDTIFLMKGDRFIDCNPKTLEMFGCTKEQIIGKTPHSRFSPKIQPDGQTSKDKASEKIRLALEGQPQVFEWKHIRYNCTPFDVQVSLNRLELSGNVFIQAIVRDITERKHAEEMLKESEERLSVIFNNTSDLQLLLSVEADKEFRVLNVNKSNIETARNLGFDVSEKSFIGKTIEQVLLGMFELSQEALDYTLKNLRQAAESGMPVFYEESFRFGNNRYDSEVTIVPVLNKSGSCLYILWSSHNITDRKKAEEKLHRARQDWENIFQAIGQPSFILDPQHKVISANRAAVKKTGIPLEHLKGKQCSELLHGKEHPPKECPMEKMLRSGCVETVEMEIEAFGGTYLVSCTPVFDNECWLEKVIHIATDISDRKETERKLREHEAQLKSLTSELSLAEERERRRIAAGIHDDIAQRLALAKLELKSMQNSISDRDTLTLLESQCKTMDRIMEDARSLTFELSNPLLYEIGVEAAVESWLTEEIQEKCGIKCKFTSQGPEISLDEDIRVVLYQGVRELLTNIVKHANANKVEVHVVKSYNQINVIVEDDGTGIIKPKLSSSERGREGFGLFNIRERLEYLGGNLNIKSTPKKGTRVTMSIPLKFNKAAQKKERLP